MTTTKTETEHKENTGYAIACAWAMMNRKHDAEAVAVVIDGFTVIPVGFTSYDDGNSHQLFRTFDAFYSASEDYPYARSTSGYVSLAEAADLLRTI